MRTPAETLAELDNIAARVGITTPGQWFVDFCPDERSGAWSIESDGPTGFAIIASRNAWPQRCKESAANALFIVNAHDDVPDLVALVRHQQSVINARLCAQHASAAGVYSTTGDDSVTPSGGGCVVCIGQAVESELRSARETIASLSCELAALKTQKGEA